MLVLHGSVLLPEEGKPEGVRFFVWGEEQDGASLSGRSSRRPKPDLHPFAAGAGILRKAVSLLEHDYPKKSTGAGAGEIKRHGTPPNVQIAHIKLPTLKGAPLSSPLIPESTAGGEQDADPDDLHLTPWLVKGLAFTPADALNFLLPLGRDDAFLPPGMAPGSDIVYWGKVAVLTMELLVRQRFIPALDAFFRADWQIIWSNEDKSRLDLLADAIPPVCLGVYYGKQECAAPGQLLEAFVQAAGAGKICSYMEKGADSGFLQQPARFLERGCAQERWLAALMTGQREISASTEQLKIMARKIEEWIKPLTAPARLELSMRTCFRLEPPRDDGGKWRLGFFLQATDDPGIILPAEQVWQEKQDSFPFQKRRFENPQERLLADLGAAVRLFPPLESGLDTPCPCGCLLDVNQAYQFLTEAAGAFEENGLGVQLPSFWAEMRRPGAGLGVRLKLNPAHGRRGKRGAGRGALVLDTLVNVDWEVALNDTTLSAHDFRILAELKAPLVNIRGKWVELNRDRMETTFKQMQEHSGRSLRLREVMRLAGEFGRDDAAGLPVLDVVASDWLEEVWARLQDAGKISLLPAPDGFCGQLRPYQVRGFSWLQFLTRWGMGACLADDMGLGKTVQTLALLLHRTRKGEETAPVLLICPTSVLGNWQREAGRFAPGLVVLQHYGPDRLQDAFFVQKANSSHLVITSYALAYRDIETLLRLNWGGVILDEAQNIKNPGTGRAKNIKRLKSGFRLALTGTPVENRLSELWSILDFLNPGLLGRAGEFREKFALPIERYGDEKKIRSLKRLVQPFILRRLKTDPAVIADLPEKQESKIFSSLTREQAALYVAVVQEMMQRIETTAGIERRGLILSLLTRLKQVCNHPAQFLNDWNYDMNRSAKLTRLTEMLEEIMACREKALVFTQFARMGEILKDHLQTYFGREILFLHGKTPQKQREEMFMRFQARSTDPPVFILSLKAGGVGLNLTRANHVFHFDRWWNPAVEEQATDRAYRIGQKQSVFVYKFICAGTLEEKIDEIMEQKKHLAQAVIGSEEDWLTGLSTEDLRKLLELGRGIVEDS